MKYDNFAIFDAFCCKNCVCKTFVCAMHCRDIAVNRLWHACVWLSTLVAVNRKSRFRPLLLTWLTSWPPKPMSEHSVTAPTHNFQSVNIHLYWYDNNFLYSAHCQYFRFLFGTFFQVICSSYKTFYTLLKTFYNLLSTLMLNKKNQK